MSSNWVPALVLLIASAAGCAAPGDSRPATVADAPLSAVQPAAEPPADPQAHPSGAPTRAYPIKFHWEADHYVAAQRPYCDPSAPWVCEYYFGGDVRNTGDFQGSARFHGRIYPDAARPGVSGTEIYVFTGKVAGCGEGTFEYSNDAYLVPEPGPSGVVRVHGDYAYIAGTASSGLAGLVDFHGTTDTWTPGVGDVIGELTCR